MESVLADRAVVARINSVATPENENPRPLAQPGIDGSGSERSLTVALSGSG